MSYGTTLRRVLEMTALGAAVVGATAMPVPGEQEGRATIAVLPFEICAEVAGQEPLDTDILRDAFSRVLVNTRKFVVVDRARLKRVRDEQIFGGSGLADAATRARVGRILGASYLVVGRILDYSVSPPREMAYGSGWTRPVRISVEVQVVDSSNGRIVTATKAAATAQSRVSDPGAAGTIPRAALEQAGEQVATQSLTAILGVAYPIRVLEVAGDDVRLNRGRDGGLAAGTVLRCFAPGTRLIDPDTKEDLGRGERAAGRVEVTEVLDKITVARVVEPGGLAAGDTCRLDDLAANEAGRHRAPPPSEPIHSY